MDFVRRYRQGYIRLSVAVLGLWEIGVLFTFWDSLKQWLDEREFPPVYTTSWRGPIEDVERMFRLMTIPPLVLAVLGLLAWWVARGFTQSMKGHPTASEPKGLNSSTRDSSWQQNE